MPSVQYCSTTHTTGNSGGSQTGSISLTIPSDCDCVQVRITGVGRTGGNPNINKLNWDNDAGVNDFGTVIETAHSDPTLDIAVYVMRAIDTAWPGTGSQTLYFGYDNAPDLGGAILVEFLKNVRQGGTTGSTEVQDTDSNNGTLNWTSSTLTEATTGSNDMSFIQTADDDGNGGTPDTGVDGQTELETGASDNGVDWSAGYESAAAQVRGDAGGTFTTYVAHAAWSLQAAITVMESGGDYNSINGASANDADGDTIYIDGSWTTDDTTSVAVSQNNTTWVTVNEARHTGRYNTDDNHHRLYASGTATFHQFTFNADNITIDGLCFHLDGTYNSRESIRVNSGSDGGVVKNCIFRGRNQSGGSFPNNNNDQDAIHLNTGACSISLENCIIYHYSRGGVNVQNNPGTQTEEVDINSCTFYGNNVENSSSKAGIMVRAQNPSATSNATIFNTYAGGEINSNQHIYYQPAGNGIVNWQIDYSSCEDNSIPSRDAGGSGNLTGILPTDSGSPPTPAINGGWGIFENISVAASSVFLLQSVADNSLYEAHSVSEGADGLTIPTGDFVGNSRSAPYSIGAHQPAGEAAPDSGIISQGKIPIDTLINIVSVVKFGVDHILSLGSTSHSSPVDSVLNLSSLEFKHPVENIGSTSLANKVQVENILSMSASSNKIPIDKALNVGGMSGSIPVEELFSSSSSNSSPIESVLKLLVSNSMPVEELLSLNRSAGSPLDHINSLATLYGKIPSEHLQGLSITDKVPLENVGQNVITVQGKIPIEELLNLSSVSSTRIEELLFLPSVSAKTPIETIENIQIFNKHPVESLTTLQPSFNISIEELLKLTNQNKMVVEHTQGLQNTGKLPLENIGRISITPEIPVETLVIGEFGLTISGKWPVETLINLSASGSLPVNTYTGLSSIAKNLPIEELLKVGYFPSVPIENLGAEITSLSVVGNLPIEHLIKYGSSHSSPIDNKINVGVYGKLPTDNIAKLAGISAKVPTEELIKLEIANGLPVGSLVYLSMDNNFPVDTALKLGSLSFKMPVNSYAGINSISKKIPISFLGGVAYVDPILIDLFSTETDILIINWTLDERGLTWTLSSRLTDWNLNNR